MPQGTKAPGKSFKNIRQDLQDRQDIRKGNKKQKAVLKGKASAVLYDLLHGYKQVVADDFQHAIAAVITGLFNGKQHL